MPRGSSLQKLPRGDSAATLKAPETLADRFAGQVEAAAIEYRLTDPEREVLRLISMGLTNRELGERMHISPNAIKASRRLIMIKMGVTTSAEILAKLAAGLKRRQVKKSEAGQVPNQQIDPSGVKIELMISKAIEVIGDRDEAMRWLGSPVRALDYATPISLLGTREGASRVQDVLGRMEHGVW